MSNFISSFLVEPVVRQARRFSDFSRPSIGSDTTLSAFDSSNSPHGESYDYEAMALQEEEQLGIRHGDGNMLQDPFLAERIPVSGLDSENERPRAQLEERRFPEVPPIVTAGIPPSSSRDRTNTRPDRASSDGVTTSSNRAIERFHTTNRSRGSSTQSAESEMTPIEESPLSRRFSSHESPRGGPGSRRSTLGDRSLPEDDGMGPMRKRIIGIQNSGVSSEEKARLIHDIMVEEYNSSQSSLHEQLHARTRSPGSVRNQERPFTPSSGHSNLDFAQAASSPGTKTTGSFTVEDKTSIHVLPDDLLPTFHSKLAPRTAQARSSDESGESQDQGEAPPLGCAHYMRNVKLQCSECERWYTCRFCHDEAEDHALIRRATKNMLCMLCGCVQPASESCRGCGVQSACYYCAICKLWDNDPEKNIYHCDDCGICRVGKGLGKDFYHCKTCVVCLSMSIRDTHKCIERSIDCDCPICGEYMFNSPQTVVFMRCGHSIHHHCYYEHIKNSYRCPICSKSMINMEMQFRQLDRAIESQPMPEQFHDTKALVYCNDCCAKTSVKYHWLGLKCAVCDSYNTAQMQILSGVVPTVEDAEAEGIIETPIPEASEMVQEDRSRHAHADPQQRPLSAIDGSLHPAFQRRAVRSASPTLVLATPEHRVYGHTNNNYADPDDAVDTDDDEEIQDDVDFWGLESPSSRDAHPKGDAERVETSDDSGEGDDDDDDELMDDELEDDDDDEAEDHMAIYGHR